MFSGFVIGLLVGLSSSAWIYAKALRRTGGNNQSALITAGLAGLTAFIITLTVVSLIDSYLG